MITNNERRRARGRQRQRDTRTRTSYVVAIAEGDRGTASSHRAEDGLVLAVASQTKLGTTTPVLFVTLL